MQVKPKNERVQPAEASSTIYRGPELVSHYASLDYLTPCERFLFDLYIKPGVAILDIGVGGGRTTPRLSSKASRYVGVDNSEEMIDACRHKFPALQFLVADASDLSALTDASFDAIVIAFNGLDCLFPDKKRWQCLEECNRLLREGGVLVFSSHNPQAIFVRPGWNRERVRNFAGKFLPEHSIFFSAALAGLTVGKAMHSLLRASWGTADRILRKVPTSAFWRGEGYLFDPADGGRITHFWTPAHVREELSRFGFGLATVLGDDYPKRSGRFVTDWNYYVFSKIADSKDEACA